MAIDCHIGAPEEFVLSFLNIESLRQKYEKFVFRDYIKVSPTFCSSRNVCYCQGIFIKEILNFQ